MYQLPVVLSSSWWKADPRAWSEIVKPWVEGSDPWPVEIVEEDFRYMLDQIRMGFMPSIPGREYLAKRWSWSSYRVRLLLKIVKKEAVPFIEKARAKYLAAVVGLERFGSLNPEKERTKNTRDEGGGVFWKAGISAWRIVILGWLGKVFPRTVAVEDARWHAEVTIRRGQPMPSRRWFMARWRLPERETRKILASVVAAVTAAPRLPQTGPNPAPILPQSGVVERQESSEIDQNAPDRVQDSPEIAMPSVKVSQERQESSRQKEQRKQREQKEQKGSLPASLRSADGADTGSALRAQGARAEQKAQGAEHTMCADECRGEDQESAADFRSNNDDSTVTISATLDGQPDQIVSDLLTELHEIDCGGEMNKWGKLGEMKAKIKAVAEARDAAMKDKAEARLASGRASVKDVQSWFASSARQHHPGTPLAPWRPQDWRNAKLMLEQHGAVELKAMIEWLIRHWHGYMTQSSGRLSGFPNPSLLSSMRSWVLPDMQANKVPGQGRRFRRPDSNEWNQEKADQAAAEGRTFDIDGAVPTFGLDKNEWNQEKADQAAAAGLTFDIDGSNA